MMLIRPWHGFSDLEGMGLRKRRRLRLYDASQPIRLHGASEWAWEVQ